MNGKNLVVLLLFLCGFQACFRSENAGEKNSSGEQMGETAVMTSVPDRPTGAAGSDLQKGNTELFFSIPGDPVTLDPHYVTDIQSYQVAYLIFESLIDVDQNLNYVPRLASSWTISDDGLMISFTLRKGLKWHDGQPVTADDVLYSFERVTSPGAATPRFKSAFDEVSAVTVRDDTTLDVTYKKPFAPALQSWSTLSILPRHHYGVSPGAGAKDEPLQPIGSGPYCFSEWKKGRFIRLTAFKNYWYSQPAIQSILFRIMPSPTIAYNSLLRGDIDGLEVTSMIWAKHASTPELQDKFEMYKFPTLNFFVIAWNGKNPDSVFAQKTIRTAMTMATDRQALIQKLLLGLAENCSGPFSPHSWGYDHTLKLLPFDLEMAGKLLDQEGWIDSDHDGIRDREGHPFRFSLLVPANNRQSEQIATMLQFNYEMIGIVMDIIRLDNAAYLDRLMKGNYQACLTALSLSIDPDNFPLLHSSQRAEGFNLTCYRNPTVDALLEEARGTFNRDKRATLYHQIHRLVQEDQPYTFLFTKPQLYIISKRIGNIKTCPQPLYLHFPGIIDWTIQSKPR